MTFNKMNNLDEKNEFSSPGLIAGLINMIKSIIFMDKGDEKNIGLLRYQENKALKKKAPCQKPENTKVSNVKPNNVYAANFQTNTFGKNTFGRSTTFGNMNYSNQLERRL